MIRAFRVTLIVVITFMCSAGRPLIAQPPRAVTVNHTVPEMPGLFPGKLVAATGTMGVNLDIEAMNNGVQYGCITQMGGITFWDSGSDRLARRLTMPESLYDKAALAPTGRFAAVVSTLGRPSTVIEYDIDSEKVRWSTTFPSKSAVLNMRFDQTGRKLIVCTSDGNIWILDSFSGAVLKIYKLRSHDTHDCSLSIGCRGRYALVSGKAGRSLEVVDLKEHKQPTHVNFSTVIKAIACSSRSNFVCVGTDKDIILCKVVRSGIRKLSVIHGNFKSIVALQISKDDRYIAASGFILNQPQVTGGLLDALQSDEKNVLRIYRRLTSQLISEDEDEMGQANPIEFLYGDRPHLISGGNTFLGGVLSDHDVINASHVEVGFHPTETYTAAFSPSMRGMLIPAEHDFFHQVVDLIGGASGYTRSIIDFVQQSSGDGLDDKVTALATCATKPLLVMATERRGIRLWDLRTGTQIQKMRQVKDGWTDLCLNGDGSVLSALPTGQVWDTASGAPLATLSRNLRGCLAAVSNDGKYFLAKAEGSLESDCKYRLYDLQGNLLGTYPHRRKSSFKRDDTLDMLDMSLAATLGISWDPTTTCAVSDGGRYIHIGSEVHQGYSIKTVDIRDGNVVRQMVVPMHNINRVRISPDATTIALIAGRRFQEWNIDSHKKIVDRPDSGLHVNALNYSPDGQFIFEDNGDHLHIWRSVPTRYSHAFLTVNEGDFYDFSGDSTTLNTVFVTPTGEFEATTLDDASNLGWTSERLNESPVPVEVFTRALYTPQLLASFFNGQRLPQTPPMQWFDSIEKRRPTIESIRITEEPGTENFVTVSVDVHDIMGSHKTVPGESHSSSGIFDVRLFRDGYLVGDKPETANLELSQSLTPSHYGAFDIDEWRKGTLVESKPGQTVTMMFHHVRVPDVPYETSAMNDIATFSAYAFNWDRVKSDTKSADFFQDYRDERVHKLKPRAYIVTIGVDTCNAGDTWNLSTAANDAHLIIDGLKPCLTDHYDVIPICLTSTNNILQKHNDRSASKTSIREVFAALSGTTVDASIPPARPEDLVFIEFSGHGFSTPASPFYFVPGDPEFAPDVTDEALRAYLNDNPVSYRNEIESFVKTCISTSDLYSWIKPVFSDNIILIVDACHSGAAVGPAHLFRPGPLGDSGFGQLAYDKGIRLLVSTQPEGVSIGDGDGLLTYALVHDGLSKGTTKTMDVDDWLSQAARDVTRLIENPAVGGKPSPILPPQFFDYAHKPAYLSKGKP